MNEEPSDHPGDDAAERRRTDVDRQVSQGPPPMSSHGPLERVEEIGSAVFFVGMTVVLLMGIWWRYVLSTPLVWTVNVATVCFLWSVMLGAPLSDWEDEHIQFDLVYKLVPEPVQLAMRTFGNLLLISALVIVIPSSYRFLDSIGDRTVVGVPWLSMQWAFTGFLVFLTLTVVQRSRLLALDLRRWRAQRREDR